MPRCLGDPVSVSDIGHTWPHSQTPVPNVGNWHITSFRGDEEFGRYRGIADIGLQQLSWAPRDAGSAQDKTDLPVGQITSTSFSHSVPREGRWPSSRTLGRDAVDAAASGA
jgi:hypothetical protein